MEDRPIILLEFNELCPALIDRWIGEGKLPNFARFRDASEVFTTCADVDEGPNLEPWIQWYSIHTGLGFDQHKVFHLTDGPKAAHPDIWGMLISRGHKVANCSSMNAKGFSAPGNFFLPDPWCTSESADPPELGVFHRFVADQVQQYTNLDRKRSLATYAGFLWFLGTHGLRAPTVLAIGRQLAGELISKRSATWKRAPLLDMLQFDVFRWYYRKHKPRFSTFFLNSTAHYQHAYWRHMEPERFAVRPPQTEIDRLKDAILFGYRQMDKLLGRFFELANDGALLILATALSQQPYLKKESIGGQQFYRPRDIDKLLRELGIRNVSVNPVMAHQFLLRFQNESEAQAAKEKLLSVHFGGSPVFYFAESQAGTLFFANRVSRPVNSDAVLHYTASGKTVRFTDVFYLIDETKSGFHHPDGLVWFRTGTHRVHTEKVSILDLFPTILDRLGVHVESENDQTYRGRVLSLLA